MLRLCAGFFDAEAHSLFVGDLKVSVKLAGAVNNEIGGSTFPGALIGGTMVH